MAVSTPSRKPSRIPRLTHAFTRQPSAVVGVGLRRTQRSRLQPVRGARETAASASLSPTIGRTCGEICCSILLSRERVNPTVHDIDRSVSGCARFKDSLRRRLTSSWCVLATRGAPLVATEVICADQCDGWREADHRSRSDRTPFAAGKSGRTSSKHPQIIARRWSLYQQAHLSCQPLQSSAASRRRRAQSVAAPSLRSCPIMARIAFTGAGLGFGEVRRPTGARSGG